MVHIMIVQISIKLSVQIEHLKRAYAVHESGLITLYILFDNVARLRTIC